MIAELKPYAEYNESGLPWLGKVPRHWETRPAFGAFVPNHERNHGMKEKTVLSLSYGRIVIKPAEKLHGLVPESFETYQIVNPGDIVLRTTDLQNDHTSLRVAMVRNRGIITSAYLALHVSKGVSPEFGLQFLNVWDTSKAIYGYGSGLRQSLDFSHFKRMTVAIPLPAEQAAIVRFLDWANGRLERAIRAKRKVIALLNEQNRTIIHRAVTRGLDPSVPLKPSGIPWLGDIPQHWEVRRLGRLSNVFNGTTPSRAKPEYWSNGTIPWLSSSKVNDRLVTSPSELITSRALAACSLSIVPSGAVLIGLIGQGRTRGMCALLAMDACVSQNLAAAVPGPHISGQYLYYTLLASYGDIRELGRGGNQAALNCEIVGRLPIPVPPLEEQRAINRALADEVRHLQPLESRLKREIDLLREYRTRLVADVVTGKLDVREAAARLPDEVPPDTDEDDTDEDDADLSDETESASEEAAA